MSRVLVVEDSPTQAVRLVRLLEAEGYEVAVARDGLEALKVLGESEADLILSEALMPHLSGYELCRKLKDDPGHRAMPVVLLTSLRDPDDIVRGLECGADNFITKPFEPQRLLSRIRWILENIQLRAEGKLKTGMDVVFQGKRVTIPSERERILDLLVSTFEDILNASRSLEAQRSELESASKRFEAFYRIAKALNSAPTIAEMHSQVLDLATGLLGVPAGWITLCDGQGGFQLSAAKGLPPALERDHAFAGRCTCQTRFLSGELEEAANIVECQRLRDAEGDAGGLSYHVTVPLRAGDQKIGLLNLAGTTELRSHNELRTLEGVGEQIAIATERAELRDKLETRMRLSEGKYRALMDNANDGIFVLDQEGNVLDVNEKGKEILARNRAEIIGRNCLEFVASSHLEKARATLSDLQVNARVEVSDIHLCRADGSPVCADISASRTALGGENFILALARDVTQRNLLTRQFYRAQKMEAIGKLAGGVAHDFNNLLTVIKGFAELADNKLDTDSPLHPYLTEISKAGDSAAALTRQLLAFGRKQPAEPQTVHLDFIVANMEKMVSHLIGEDIELATSFAPSLPSLEADPGQIEQIIMNLAANARDAMPEGGRLTIETDQAVIDEDYASRHFKVEPGSYILLSVSDTGCGMSEEVQSRLFEPFFTTKGPEKGTGLGLATVYGIVKQYGGHIWTYSEEGRGTTFKMYFPHSKRPSAQTSRQPQSADPVSGGSETILLAEDDPGVRSFVQKVLQEAGYQVHCAENAERAESLFLEHADSIDLLLTDVVMPGGDGSRLHQRLAARKAELRVVFMSGHALDADGRFDRPNRDLELLHKPFSRNMVLRRVREALDRPPH